MEFGIGMFGDNHYDKNGKPLPADERLKELIEEIKLMDETGLDFLALASTTGPIMPYRFLKLYWPLQLL